MAYHRNLTARRILLAKATSALALATGLAIGSTGPAHAQATVPGGAFEGNPVVVSGGVNIVRGPGTDDIRVDTNQAVINWTTNDTAIGGGLINFLPIGRTVTYRNNPTAQNNFTVLNRIIPTDPSRAIAMNGTIISQLQTGAGLVSGGNVWFYSPGGIVIGATGVIDVGGLLLTSLDPVRDAGGNFVTAGGSFTLGPAASATSYVQIDAGAQVRLTPQNSYVAMVAPIIRQNGSVNVNGSAAYVAAEAATLTFGNGLFNIQVTTGTNGDAAAGNTAIAHNGSTSGPASSGAGDTQRIYMVAVPKNNAITMAIGAGSTLGFDIAGAANVEGNSIILSSGFNVTGDTINTTPVNPAQQASITLSSGTITSAINAAAAFRTNVSVGSGTLNLAGNARFHGDNQVTVSAFGTGTIAAARDLTVSADRVGLVDGQSVTGGNAQLYAQAGGTVRVLGNAFVTANGQGAGNLSGQVGAGTGGTADVRAFGNALMDIAGNLVVSADGRAGTTGSIGTTSNNGTGGTVIVTSGRNATVDNNSTMVIGGNLQAMANGYGSGNFGAGVGGIGRGGSIQINSGSGTGIASVNNVMTVNGLILSNADGFGGRAFTTGTGGAGFGGTNSINAGVGGRINVAGNATLTSFGFGGGADDGNGNGGNGTGGFAIAQIFGSGGVLSFGSTLLVQANGTGGSSGVGTTSAGGIGRGGNASVALGATQTGGAIAVQGLTQVEALGLGGAGTIGGDGFGGLLASGGGAFVSGQATGTMTLRGGVQVAAGGVGGTARQSGAGRTGNGTGGTAQIVAVNNSIINITGEVGVNANGSVFTSTATGIDGGDGVGGAASISQGTGGLISITGNALVSATGTGHANTGGGDGIAGNGTGGDVRIAVNNRSITITGNATTDARGIGGASQGGIRGGNGTGGLANLGAGAGTLTIGGIGTANADGTGGSATGTGSGGNGTGGQAIIGSIIGGIIGITGAANATAQGFAGSAIGPATTGGIGQGGTAQLFTSANGSLTVGGPTTLNASGFGGSASGGGNSGNGLGGTASLLANGNGQMTLNQNTLLSTQGLSGNVTSGGGNVGTATGGTANMLANGAGSVITVNGTLRADAIGQAGSALTGTIGAAQGGTVVLQAATGTFNVAGAVSLDASAIGGNSTQTGNGGNATGGRSATLIAGAGGGRISLGSTLTMASNGTGGSAQTGNGGTGTGGIGEIGTIGIIGNFAFGGNITMTANGTGGSSLLAGNGGAGTGGQASLGSNSSQMVGRDVGIQANGRGGNGALGGTGGAATGGRSAMFAGNGTITGLLDFDNINLFAEAFGGNGGTGATGGTGGAGGAGGNATGGAIVVTSAAGNGQLDLSAVRIIANGTGGAGGAGGVGTAGRGGIGGAGGRGTGGFSQLGTESSTGAETVNVGFTLMTDALNETNGFGGAGGNGGTGTTGLGNGGAGGIGEGGANVLLARGSRLTLNNATLISNGVGGNGGTGAVAGAGGNGIGGGVAFAFTDRFNLPAQRGIVQANELVGVAEGQAGTGSTSGQTFHGTGSNIEIRNADVTANRFVINTSGAAPNPVGIVEDFIRVTDGRLNVTGSLTYITPGQLSVLVNNGSVNAGAFGVRASSIVRDTVVTAPNAIGTITAAAMDLQSAGGIIVTANLATTANFSAVGTGAINLLNVNAGGIIGIQGGSLQLGNLVAGTNVNLTTTTGAISAGTVTAGNLIAMTAANGLTLALATATNGSIDLLVNAGNMTIGNLTSGTFLKLETRGGSIAVGDLNIGTDINLAATGTLRFGNANSGLSFSASGTGGIIGGNIAARGTLASTSYSVGLRALGGNIAVGNVSGPRNVGLLAAGNIVSGSLTSGEDIVLLAPGTMQINGAVTGGTGANRYVYIANASMAALLPPDLNPSVLFGQTPVRTLGGLTIAGPVTTGNLRAGIGTTATINGTVNATGGAIGLTAGSVAAQAMNASLSVALNATTGALSVGNIVASGTPAAGGIVLSSAGTINAGILATGTTAGLGVTVDGQGAVSIGGVTATGAAQLRSRSASFTSTGAITAATVTIGGTAATLANVSATGGNLTIAAGGGNLAFGALNSTGRTQLNATGSITGGNIGAGTSIGATSGGGMTLANLTAGQEIILTAGGSAAFGNVDAGQHLAVQATTGITGGNIVTRGALAGTFFGTGLVASGPVQTGTVQSARNIGVVTTGALTSAALTSAESIVLLADGNIQINGAISAGTTTNRFFYIGNSSMRGQFGGGGNNQGAGGLASFLDGDPAPIFALNPVRTLGSLTVAGQVTAGNVRAGIGTTATFSSPVTAVSGSIDIAAGSLAAQAMNGTLGVNLVTTSGGLAAGAIAATAGNINLTSSSTVTTGALATGTGANLVVTVDGQGSVSIGGVTATGAAQLRSRSASFTSTGAVTAASVNISGTAATLANVTSTNGGITIAATGGNLVFGALNSATNTQFNVAGSVTGGDITAGTSIGTIVTGNMTLGNLRTTAAGTTSSGFSIGLGAGGTITTGTINSFGLLGIGSDDGQGNFGNAASITTGAITAGGTVLLRANQAIVTGNVSSTNEIRLRGGSITTGALQATNAIFAAATNGSLTTGNVTTGTNALLLASQNILAGNISTGTAGTALLASSAGVSPTANLSQTDLNALLAATPQRVGGSVAIGATTTGTLLGASTGTFSANSTITAGTRISLDVGSTAVFGGLAVAPTIAISSGDIAFSQAGGLGNANTGSITLTANRSGPVVIGGTGDGQSQQTGYTLDGSEISRIRAQSITINAPNVSATGTGVEIRALTMNGSTAASGVNLNGTEGSLTINTPGTIRVNGNAVFNAMATTNRVALNANRVEINADTGGTFLNGSSPGGILSINANNIHIASASLLEQLASNVNFAGRDIALGLPIATSRPDGVIQASRLQFTVGSTLLIQNTGTSLLNAGFFGRVGSFQVSPRTTPQNPTNLIDLVIYGQLLDTGDLVRNGTSVRDLIFPRSTGTTGQDRPSSISGFTSNSSVNGCLLTAITCGTGGITEQGPTAVVHAGPPRPRPAAEREQQEREQEEVEAEAGNAASGTAHPRRPILPPVNIVNTRRLGVEPIIDEPVTGGGNPNLQLDQPLPEPVPDTGGQP